MTRPILEGFLNQLHDNTPNLLASTIVSVDGIALAWLLSRHINPDCVGGMSAALLSLGSRAAKELECGRLKQVVVEGDDGFTVLVQAGEQTVLVTTASAQAKERISHDYARHSYNGTSCRPPFRSAGCLL